MAVKDLTTTLIPLRHDQLVAAGDNLRGTLTDVTELADSIAAQGLIQPLRVTMTAGAKKATIVAGHRRHAAIGHLIIDGRWPKTKPIPCTLDGDIDDEHRILQMLVENLQRVDLDPIEEASGYQQLIDGYKHTRASLHEATGRSKTTVAGRLQLLKLPTHLQEKVSDGRIPVDTAIALAKLGDADIERLTAGGRIPTPNDIAAAVTQAQDAANRDKFRTIAADRGYPISTDNDWRLAGTHDSLEVSLAAFPKAILPEPAHGVAVTFNVYTLTVKVWTPRPASTDPAEPATPPASTGTTPNADVEWQQECARLRRDHTAAIEEWRRNRNAAIARWADKVTTKDVAAAALHTIAHESGVDPAYVGFDAPENVDQDTIDEAVTAWLRVPANLTAYTAVTLLTEWSTACPAFVAQFEEANGIPAPPDYPTLPPHPSIAHIDDTDDDGADEDATDATDGDS